MRRAEEEKGEIPLQRLEADNKRLTETCMRSELENEMLALELVNDRVRLKGSLDQVCLFCFLMKILFQKKYIFRLKIVLKH
jgi:hypothetical protein